MKCKFCGNEVDTGAKYCPVCGTEVTQSNENGEGEQPAAYEDPNKEYGYGYGQPGYSQGDYGQSDGNQGSYGGYGQSDGSQGSYGGYGQSNVNQGNYGGYGQSDGNQGNYGGYGQSDVNQGNYGDYGQSDSSQGNYGGYGQQNGDQGNYGGYSQPGNNQGGYSYGQSGNDYGQPGNFFNQPAYGQPIEEISSTPYIIFSILTTICCCRVLGIVSIVYASKIKSLQRMGDYAGAKEAARKAKIFSIVGAVVGLILSVIVGVTGTIDELTSEFGNNYGGTSVMSNLLDDEDDEDEDQDEDEEKEKPAAPAVVSGDLGESWKSYTVQINETVLTFPCSIAEVEATGLVMDTENMPEDYVINKDDYELVFFDDEEYHSLMFVISNNEEEARTVRECTVNGVYVNDYDVEDGAITVVFPGGIQMGADISQVIEKWGEPDDSYEGDYSDSYSWYDGDSSNYCAVSTDPDTDKVITIDLDGQKLK